MFTKYNSVRLPMLLATSLVWAACKPNDLEFQTFKPTSETSLSDLFKDTPAIRAAFTTIDPHEFNVRLDGLIRFDPVMGVKSMHALGALSKDRPALPQLADAVSSTLDRFARYYQATPARQSEYNAAIDLVNRLLDVDPKAITDGAYLLARGVRYTGESKPMFPLSYYTAYEQANPDSTYAYPALSTWKACDDPGSIFLKSKPKSDATDVEGRDTLWQLYDLLRTGFCIYANRSGPRIEIVGAGGTGATAEAVITNSAITGINVINPGSGYPVGTTVVNIDSSPGPGSGATATATVVAGQVTGITVTANGSAYVPKSDNTPGAYMRNATAVLKNSGDVELRIRNLIYDLTNTLPDYDAAERRIADWTVNQSNIVFQSQVAVTDYIIDYVYPITRKDFVFNDGKEVLDREAEHLSMKNPGGAVATNDEYLIEWLLESLYKDAPKMDALEQYSNIDTNSTLYKFGSDIVHNATYGINAATSRYSKFELRKKLWDGWAYTCNCTAGSYTFVGREFKGLLKEGGAPGWTDDGYLTQLAQISSTQNFYNHYRRQMGTAVSALVAVPSTYNNEVFLESALKNYYYYVLSRYYDQAQLKWAFTPEDGQTFFSDPARNLQSYLGNMQYSLRNTMILDKNGKKPGDAGFDNIPYLTSFLYTVAGANGYVDKDTTPERLTLADCLKSNGSTIGTTPGVGYGQKTIAMPGWASGIIPDMVLQVTDGSQGSNGNPNFYAYRNGVPFTSSMSMSAFELISPGRFIPRDGSTHYFNTPPNQDLTTNGRWRGKFSGHQGMVEDVDNPGQANRTADWMMNEFSFAAWRGYGPYTFKGKGANGSKLKYENHYYTDNYRAAYNVGHTLSDPDYRTTPMGYNGGDAGNSWAAGDGNYHIYERVYRPLSASDPCWVDSQGSTYGYARYGYLRPHNNQSYWDNNGCLTWTKVRVDFDTMEEAVRANVEWVLKYKKYVFVIPMWGYTNMNILINNGASFSVFSTINANGLYGVTRAKRHGGTPASNGLWTHSCLATDGVNPDGNAGGCVSMNPDSNGIVDNTTFGLVNDDFGPANGAAITKKYGVTSYYPADSMILMDNTLNSWGLSNLLVDIFKELWGSLGDGYVTPQLLLDNMDSVMALVNAKYTESDISAAAPPLTASSLSKFQRFFDMMFPTDEEHWDAPSGTMIAGAGGGPDLYERYSHALIKDIDMPPVPRVQGASNCSEFITTGCTTYPTAFNATTGAVTAWGPHKAPSDGKFSGILLPLIMIFGTMQEDGTTYKLVGNPNDINNSTVPFGSPLAANEDSDTVPILSFGGNGYRTQFAVIFDALASLNEHKRIGGAGANKNLPLYDATALTNVLTESGPGLRNGIMPKLMTNKYANVAYIDPLVRDIEALIADNVRKAEDSFYVTSGSYGTFTPGANYMKNKDRLRYFATKNAVTPSLPVTVSASTPAIFTASNHGLEIGDKVFLTTTGALPPEFTPTSVFYYVVGPVTADNFRLADTPGGPAKTASPGQSGTHAVNPALFKTNRFNASVNSVALNSIPMNMLKQFVAYLRTLTSDAEIVAAVKAAIPMLNNYLVNVQNSSSTISLTDQDIDHIVSFIKDTNKTGGYSVDTFLDMLVSTKMDDLNTLRSFNFNQFKTLGSYQTVFDDMNDKISKYFDVDVKKDLLYGPFLLGEPTCPGGSANGFYDHNKDGVWNPGTFTFINAAYAGASTYTDTANVGGSCAITTQIPNIYDKNYYMFDMGGVARNIKKSVLSLTSTDIDRKLDWLYGRSLTGAPGDVIQPGDTMNQPNPETGKDECYIKTTAGVGISFDNEVTAVKNLLLCKMYNTKISEPHYDRNGNNIVEAGEYTDINNNGQYDDDNATGSNVMNLRKTIHYFLEDVFMPKYQDFIHADALSPNKNYVHFGVYAMRDLFSPTACDDDGLNCSTNTQYLTADLLAARSAFYASTNFTSAELKSVKNVVGNFLYDSDSNTYTSLMYKLAGPATGMPLVTLLREFQGDYNDLLNMGLEGFQPNGFMTYFSTNLKNKDPYTSLDILTDVRTLFNTQTMRCYPGITGEYPSGPMYCKKYKALDTFWGQFGLLMNQFSTAAYNKYKAQWQSQLAAPYYSRLVSMFE
ncbi:MAG: hypothetical protein U1F27_05935 [Turneriella sp.]